MKDDEIFCSSLRSQRLSGRPVVLLLALVTLFAPGCSRAVITDTAITALSGTGQKLKSDLAVFSVDAKGRQTVLLAVQPTGQSADASDAGSTPGSPPPSPGPAAATGAGAARPAAMKYRAYLLLVVNSGGGEFTIGQRFIGGQVTASYYVYDEHGEPNILPDNRGTITTRQWPLTGGLDPNDWWTSGSFDLVMGNQKCLTGSFVARPAPVLIERFIRDHKL